MQICLSVIAKCTLKTGVSLLNEAYTYLYRSEDGLVDYKNVPALLKIVVEGKLPPLLKCFIGPFKFYWELLFTACLCKPRYNYFVNFHY